MKAKVIFFGASATKACGGPLTNDIWSDILSDALPNSDPTGGLARAASLCARRFCARAAGIPNVTRIIKATQNLRPASHHLEAAGYAGAPQRLRMLARRRMQAFSDLRCRVRVHVHEHDAACVSQRKHYGAVGRAEIS
jgi:hypothetical protein